MVIEALVMVVVGLFVFLASLFPEVSLPGWVDSLAGHVSSIGGWAAPLGIWLPFGAMGDGVAFVMLCLGVAFVVKLFRMISSYMTGGGGASV